MCRRKKLGKSYKLGATKYSMGIVGLVNIWNIEVQYYWLHYIAILLSIEIFLDEMSTYINIQSTGSWSTFLRKKKDTSGVWTPTYSFVYWEKEYIHKYTEEKKRKATVSSRIRTLSGIRTLRGKKSYTQ